MVDAGDVGQRLQLTLDGLPCGDRVEAASIEELGELEELDVALLGEGRPAAIAAFPRAGGGEPPLGCGFDEAHSYRAGPAPTRMLSRATVTGRRDGHREGIARLKRLGQAPIGVPAEFFEAVELDGRAITSRTKTMLELRETMLGSTPQALGGSRGHVLCPGQQALDHREGRSVETTSALPFEMEDAFFEVRLSRHGAALRALRRSSSGPPHRSWCWRWTAARRAPAGNRAAGRRARGSG